MEKIRRERVRDRSLGRTSEKLYRKVNSYAAKTIPIRNINRPEKQRSRPIRPKLNQKFFSYNGRSKSMHDTSLEQVIAKALEREDRRISLEYMHIVSLPLSSSEKDGDGSRDEAFYLGGPEYNVWCTKRSASSSRQLCATLNRTKVTGMFKSQLRPIRQTKGPEQIERSTAVGNKESEKVDWGEGALFLAASHACPSGSKTIALVPSRTFSRPNAVARFMRSCFATPCRPRIELARKTQSSVQVAAKTTPEAKLLLTSLPRNTSFNSFASPGSNSKCSIDSFTTADNGTKVDATNNQAAVHDHTKNIEVQLLVDGQSKAVGFPFDFMSSKEKPIVQVVEVLLDGVSLWRRKQSLDMRNGRGSSSAKQK